MNKIRLFFLICSVLCLSSCILFSNNNDENKIEDIPAYDTNVLWTVDFHSFSFSNRPLQLDKFLVGIDVDTYSAEEKFTLYKFNLETGRYEWISEPQKLYRNIFTYEPALCDGKLFLYCCRGYVKCFDYNTGDLLATVYLYNSDPESEYDWFGMCGGTRIVSMKDKYLLWASNRDNMKNDDGVMKLCIDEIDFTKAPDEVQRIEPKRIWTGERLNEYYKVEEHIESNLVVDEKNVYFLTRSAVHRDFPCRLGAIDCESEKLLWIKEIGSASGEADDPLMVVGDYLYSLERASGCYMKETGETVWEHDCDNEDLRQVYYIGGCILNNAGYTYKDGRIYFTNVESQSDYTSFGYPKELSKNIKCIDASTGEYIWGYMPEGSASLSTRPVIAGGKVFVNTWGLGLYVFDEETGNLIGVDKSIYSAGGDRNAVWNDNVYIFNYDNKKQKRTLICIKP